MSFLEGLVTEYEFRQKAVEPEIGFLVPTLERGNERERNLENPDSDNLGTRVRNIS